MFRTKIALMIGSVILAVAAVWALARRPSSPPSGGMPPQRQRFIEATRFRRELRSHLPAIEEIDGNPATALSPAQARQLLAILKPWTTRDAMTEEDAKEVTRSVEQVLTARQLAAMRDALPPPGGGFGGGRFSQPGIRGPGARGGAAVQPGGFGAPRGPGGGGGWNPERIKEINLISTKADPNRPWAARSAQRIQQILASLEARAHEGTTHGQR
jgi:hypothetical protein